MWPPCTVLSSPLTHHFILFSSLFILKPNLAKLACQLTGMIVHLITGCHHSYIPKWILELIVKYEDELGSKSFDGFLFECN
jgi:hypothetical protein